MSEPTTFDKWWDSNRQRWSGEYSLAHAAWDFCESQTKKAATAAAWEPMDCSHPHVCWQASIDSGPEWCAWCVSLEQGKLEAAAAEREQMRPAIEGALDVLGIMRDVATRDFQIAAQMKAEMAIAGLKTAIREEAGDE